jgi:hypothetical protein
MGLRGAYKRVLMVAALCCSSCAIDKERRRICTEELIKDVRLCVWRNRDIKKNVAGCIWDFEI